MFRKQFCVVLAGAVAFSFGFTAAATAQQYPDKPIKLIVPYPPGATNDLLARVLAEPLAKELGQPVIVDNKGGAATAIGATATANAPADGYTMLLGTGTTYTLNPLLKKGLAYDTDRDFKMVSIIAEVPVVFIVNPKFPARTLSGNCVQADPCEAPSRWQPGRPHRSRQARRSEIAAGRCRSRSRSLTAAAASRWC